FYLKKPFDTGGRGIAAPPSDRDHDLADLLVGFHVAMRLDDLLERKGARDHGLELALLQTVQDETLAAFQPRGVGRQLEQHIAADGQAFAKHREERQGRRLRTDRKSVV